MGDLLHRRGICGTTGTRSERDAGTVFWAPGLSGRRPPKGQPRRIDETPPLQQEGMAWIHGLSGLVFCALPLPQDGSFSISGWRKANSRRRKRTHGRTRRFSPQARGFAGRMMEMAGTAMPMGTGGMTEAASGGRWAAQPRRLLGAAWSGRMWKAPAPSHRAKAFPGV